MCQHVSRPHVGCRVSIAAKDLTLSWREVWRRSALPGLSRGLLSRSVGRLWPWPSSPCHCIFSLACSFLCSLASSSFALGDCLRLLPSKNHQQHSFAHQLMGPDLNFRQLNMSEGRRGHLSCLSAASLPPASVVPVSSAAYSSPCWSRCPMSLVTTSVSSR